MDLKLEKLAKIEEMYAAGIPLFTKDSMQDLHRELSKAKTGDNVSVLNFDGTTSEFEITVGNVYPPWDKSEFEIIGLDFDPSPPGSEVIQSVLGLPESMIQD